MSEEAGSSLRYLPTFDGRRTHFWPYSKKMIAKLASVGLLDIVLQRVAIPSKAEFEAAEAVNEDDRTPGQALVVKRYRNLMRAHHMITFSIDTDMRSGLGAFQIIENSVTQANPDGDPSLAWHNLNQTYAARNVPSYFNYLQMYCSTRLQGNNMPPEELITRLEYLRGETSYMNRLPNIAELSEQDTIMHLLNFLPALHDSKRLLIMEMLEQDPDAVMLEVLRKKLTTKYDCTRIERRGEQLQHEHAIAAIADQIAAMDQDEVAAWVSRFKGTCNKCG